MHHITEIIVSGMPHLNNKDVETAVESFYRKLVIADKYKPATKLSSDITLIKATEKHQEAGALGADYGLSQVLHCIINYLITPLLPIISMLTLQHVLVFKKILRKEI